MMNNNEILIKLRDDIDSLSAKFDDGIILFNPQTKDTTLFNLIVEWLINHFGTNEFCQHKALAKLLLQYPNDCPIKLSELYDNSIEALVNQDFIKRI